MSDRKMRVQQERLRRGVMYMCQLPTMNGIIICYNNGSSSNNNENGAGGSRDREREEGGGGERN